MVVTLDEMKKYLRVDFEDDDTLLRNIMESAQTLCMDVARITDEDAFEEEPCARIAVMYAVAYADLILNGDPETYLKTVTEYKTLDS